MPAGGPTVVGHVLAHNHCAVQKEGRRSKRKPTVPPTVMNLRGNVAPVSHLT